MFYRIVLAPIQLAFAACPCVKTAQTTGKPFKLGQYSQYHIEPTVPDHYLADKYRQHLSHANQK